ncbi:hypothetical protein HAX54_029549 [Datura stramonium]|uniref:Uncharacterized protein n=1 Tax=Datura stramonium TaxID=4076 RepID=A0ABS8SA89_DATST|nr:hypothetical protein [Datura stramonium]
MIGSFNNYLMYSMYVINGGYTFDKTTQFRKSSIMVHKTLEMPCTGSEIEVQKLQICHCDPTLRLQNQSAICILGHEIVEWVLNLSLRSSITFCDFNMGPHFWNAVRKIGVRFADQLQDFADLAQDNFRILTADGNVVCKNWNANRIMDLRALVCLSLSVWNAEWASDGDRLLLDYRCAQVLQSKNPICANITQLVCPHNKEDLHTQ